MISLANTHSQWNTTFGAPPIQPLPQHQPSMRHPSSGGQDASGLSEMQGSGLLPLPHGSNMSPNYATQPPVPSFVSPSMWQESVASVYEGGSRRDWVFSNNK